MRTEFGQTKADLAGVFWQERLQGLNGGASRDWALELLLTVHVLLVTVRRPPFTVRLWNSLFSKLPQEIL